MIRYNVQTSVSLMSAEPARPNFINDQAVTSSPPRNRLRKIAATSAAEFLVHSADSQVNWTAMQELKPLLEEFLCEWHGTSGDGDIVSWESWTRLLKPVEQYLDSPRLQTPRMTKYLLVHLLECVLR